MNLELLLAKTSAQLAFLTTTELKTACKLLEIKGYSKLKKAELLELITPIHASVVSRYTGIDIEEAVTPAKEIIISQKTYELCSVAHLETIFTPKPTPEEFQATVPAVCRRLLLDLQAVYSTASIVGGMTKKMIGTESFKVDRLVKTEGSLDQLRFHERNIDDDSSRLLIKNTWKELIKPLRVAIKERYLTEVARGASKNHEKKKLDNLGAITWAKANLEATTPLVLGFALAILSGRRLVEIFGTTQYFLLGDFIKIKGVAKSAVIGKEGVFVPLCPAKDWLAAMNRLAPHRLEDDGDNGEYEKRLNTLTKTISRQLKLVYASLGLKSFKDARDVYAVTCYRTALTDKEQSEQTRILQSLLCHSGSDAVEFYKKFNAEAIPELLPLLTRYTEEIVASST